MQFNFRNKLEGFKIKGKNRSFGKSYIMPNIKDGEVKKTLSYGNETSINNISFDHDTNFTQDNELINYYRSVASYPLVSTAIDLITNEAINITNDNTLTLNLDETEFSDEVKEAINEEFKHILKLYKFKFDSHEMFRDWYVDGRLYYEIILGRDSRGYSTGVEELRQINPFNIRKVYLINKTLDDRGNYVYDDVKEYFIYSENYNILPVSGMRYNSMDDFYGNNDYIVFEPDSIVYASSGLYDRANNVTISHLNKACRIVNQLKMLEDSLVIYRIARAPERRVIYIDVDGVVPSKHADKIREFATSFKNDISYNTERGTINSNNVFQSVMEDYFLPRYKGKNTEITTLEGGQKLGEVDDVAYFENRVYQSLNIPISRLQQSNGFTIGRSNEITQEEVAFHKFITRLRLKFSEVFMNPLRVHLITKRIITAEEWEDNYYNIDINYPSDVNFAELLKLDILKSKIEMIGDVEPYIGKFFSKRFVFKDILNLSEEELHDTVRQIERESNQNEENLQSVLKNILAVANEMPDEDEEQNDFQNDEDIDYEDK